MNEDDAVGGELRTVGILGGVNSQSTVEYYRPIDEGINDVHGSHHVAELLTRSVDFGVAKCYIRTERWDDATDYPAAVTTDLEAGGADLVVMAANTMHRAAPRIEAALSTPFLHIVDAIVDAILADELKTVDVPGIRTTMDGAFYRERFEEHGIDVIVPEESRRDEIDQIVLEGLTKGEIREASRDYCLKAVDQLAERGADGTVLGRTEIELLVEQADRPDVPLFDMTASHIEWAVERSLAGRADG